MKPIILITASLMEDERFIRLDRAYTESITQAGGVPLIPDFSDDILSLSNVADGILFSGGVDIDPGFFDEEPRREIGESTPLRDYYELELLKAAIKRNMPILGICRGAQLINAGLGGKLFQDIYSEVIAVPHNTNKNKGDESAYNSASLNLTTVSEKRICYKKPLNHSQKMPKKYASHSVSIYEGSVLRDIAKCENIRVNSFHHQAVSVLGDGLRITAEAPDGIIEAFEHSNLSFLMGIQWHPEQMHESVHRAIFSKFVNACLAPR